jgi:hypothetical protein
MTTRTMMASLTFRPNRPDRKYLNEQQIPERFSGTPHSVPKRVRITHTLTCRYDLPLSPSRLCLDRLPVLRILELIRPIHPTDYAHPPQDRVGNMKIQVEDIVGPQAVEVIVERLPSDHLHLVPCRGDLPLEVLSNHPPVPGKTLVLINTD